MTVGASEWSRLVCLMPITAGLFAIIGTTRAVRSGTIRWGKRSGGAYEWKRSEKPFDFWGFAVLYYLWGFFVLAIGLYWIVRGPPK